MGLGLLGPGICRIASGGMTPHPRTEKLRNGPRTETVGHLSCRP